MFFHLFFLSFSDKIYIQNETISSIVLNDGDELTIDGTSKTLFLHTSAHYFSGQLSLSSSHSGTTEGRVLSQSQRLMFYDSIVTISYVDAQSPVKLDVYLLDSQSCFRKSIHIRGIKKSRIFSPEFGPIIDPICYFYDFGIETNYKTNFPEWASAEVTLIRQIDNGLVVYENMDGKVSVEKLPSKFVVQAKDGNMSYIDINFNNERVYGDWTDEDSNFECWPDYLCESLVPFDYHVTNDRTVAWWIWTVLSLGLAIPLTILIVCMFTKPDDYAFSGNTIQPLLSLQSRN